MKRIGHEQMLHHVLNSIGKTGIVSMHQLHQFTTLEDMFLTALHPWLEGRLTAEDCASLLKEIRLTPGEAATQVLDALLSQQIAHGSRRVVSCRMDLVLRQADHGADAALGLMYHTVYHLCLDMVRRQRRAG